MVVFFATLLVGWSLQKEGDTDQGIFVRYLALFCAFCIPAFLARWKYRIELSNHSIIAWFVGVNFSNGRPAGWSWPRRTEVLFSNIDKTRSRTRGLGIFKSTVIWSKTYEVLRLSHFSLGRRHADEIVKELGI